MRGTCTAMHPLDMDPRICCTPLPVPVRPQSPLRYRHVHRPPPPPRPARPHRDRQIDQTVDPVRITISGTPHALNLAVSMIQDVVRGTFKGFALLRQSTLMNSGAYPGQQPAPRPVYAPGYGLIPPSQLYGGEAAPQALNAAAYQPVPGGGLPRLGMGMGMQQAAAYHYFQQPQMAPSQLVMVG